MSQARNIYALIQEVRDEMKERWRDRDAERHLKNCERDIQCEDLQGKIVEMFPDEFRHMKGAKDV